MVRKSRGGSQMSANNQLVILKGKEFFEVHQNYCVDNDFEPSEEQIMKLTSKLKDTSIAKLGKKDTSQSEEYTEQKESAKQSQHHQEEGLCQK